MAIKVKLAVSPVHYASTVFYILQFYISNALELHAALYKQVCGSQNRENSKCWREIKNRYYYAQWDINT